MPGSVCAQARVSPDTGSGGGRLNSHVSGHHISASNIDVKVEVGPWLVQLSGLSTCLRAKMSPAGFPVRARAWVVGQVPSRGRVRDNHTLMFLSLSVFLPFPSLKINNKIFKKRKWKLVRSKAPCHHPIISFVRNETSL